MKRCHLQNHLHIAVGLLLTAALSGCQLPTVPELVTCPLPASDQVTEILSIVPMGTNRDKAVELLQKAGIRGTFNDNRTIFYCDVWEKDKSLRWHINVALLFDEDSQLYATRPDREGRIDPSPRKSQKASSAANAGATGISEKEM